jgi:uncharacterized membrane protein
MVLIEAQRNIQNKLNDEAANRFYYLLDVVPFTVAPLPDRDEIENLTLKVNKKDAHVIAAALAIHAPILLSLDKGRF